MRRLALLAACLLLGGCYWSSPPDGPFGHVRQDPDPKRPLAPAILQTLVAPRPVLLGRFDTTAPQPIGGLYDRANYHLATLYRTYFFRDGAVEIFEHTADALRAAGVGVLKDYASQAEPALVEAPLRKLRPVLVSGTVRALQHDLIRTDDEETHTDAAVLHLTVDIRVAEADGTPRLAKTYVVDGTLHYDANADALDMLGAKLAEALTHDPEFVTAIGATTRGS
jgi:hypothetical protein